MGSLHLINLRKCVGIVLHLEMMEMMSKITLEVLIYVL